MGGRGQMSLEMIVGFVILLVVASVTIGLFLNVVPTGGDDIGGTGQLRSLQEIRTQCQSRCQDWKTRSGDQALAAAIDYCTERFNYDENQDGSVSQTAGSGFNTYCEDGVHCFNVYECSKDFEDLTAEKCREIMCEYYQDEQNVEDPSQADAGQRVYRFFEPGVAETDRGAGTCGIRTVEDPTGARVNTWWNASFSTNDTDGTLTDSDYMYVCRDR